MNAAANHFAWKHKEVAAMRRRELEAQAIGVLDVLLADGDIRSVEVRYIALLIVREWDALGAKVAA